jgi:hypothetical protein
MPVSSDNRFTGLTWVRKEMENPVFSAIKNNVTNNQNTREALTLIFKNNHE